MNVYGSQIWPCNKTYLIKFYVAWSKAIRRIWKLHIIELRTNYSISSTFVCLPIDFTLEKCSIKYIWNLINADNKIYVSIVKLSLCNNSTTLGENIRYFMYKYKIYDYEWYASNKVTFKKLIVIFCLVLIKVCSVIRSPSESYVSHVTHINYP